MLHDATLRFSRFTALALVSFATMVGCSSAGLGGGGGGGGGAPDPEPTDLGSQARQDLAACRGGVSEGVLDDSLEIAAGFRQSCHELVVCGGLAAQMSGAVIQLFVNAALGASTDSGLKFDGKGTYVSAGGALATNMEVTLHLPADTSFGKKGDLIPYDLLSVDTYFTGAKLEAVAKIGPSGVSHDVRVSFTGTGPGFELLGIQASGSEMKLDTDAIAQALGRVGLRAKTHVDDEQGRSTFVYDMTSPETTLGALFDGGGIAFRLDGITGGRSDLRQSLTTTTFDVQYVGGKVGKLDGSIGFAIDGGPLPFAATFQYPRSNEPVVRFACR